VKLRVAGQISSVLGFKTLQVLIVLDDKKGGAELVETAMKGAAGVRSVEIVEMGLLLD